MYNALPTTCGLLQAAVQACWTINAKMQRWHLVESLVSRLEVKRTEYYVFQIKNSKTNKNYNTMRKLSMWAMCLFVVGNASAQKISGSLVLLKGQKEVNVELNFSGTLVNGKAESTYISDETKGKNETEKSKWLKEWNEDLRSQAYAMLTNDLGKHLSNGLFKVGNYPNADYTILIKVVDITTGFFAGPFAKASAVKADVKFIKTGGTSPIATVSYKKSCSAISSTIPYFVTRIVMSFGKLGDDIAKSVNKKLK